MKKNLKANLCDVFHTANDPEGGTKPESMRRDGGQCKIKNEEFFPYRDASKENCDCSKHNNDFKPFESRCRCINSHCRVKVGGHSLCVKRKCKSKYWN